MLTDIYSIILIIIVIILLLLNYELKYIFIIIFIIGLILYYINNTNVNSGYLNKIKDISKNDIVIDILNNIGEHKYLNLIEYKYGMKYWNLFINKYDNINNTYDYDKCKNLLLKCIEHFKSLNLSPDNDNIIISINNLYSEGSELLKIKAKKLNSSWEKFPDISKRQIILDSPLPYNVSFK